MAKLRNSSKQGRSNFFFGFFSSLFGSNDPEVEKKRKLKSISKLLNKSKYKFYKYNSGEALGQMAKFFHEIYKIIAPAQAMFQSLQNPNALKNATINFSLTKKQLEIIDKLDENYILELSKTKKTSEIAEEIKNNISLFSTEFDLDRMNNIDSLYSKIITFKNFCNFDYYFLLKKFDSSLRERDFNYIPRFENIRAEYVLDDLKDFISIAWTMPLDENWNDVLNLLKQMRGIQIIPASNWTKVINRLKELRNSQVFEMIIQLISKDPNYVTNITSTTERICEPYIEKLRSQAISILKKIDIEKTNFKINEILMSIFGTTNILRLKNYTEAQNTAFLKKNLTGFLYTAPLNYMKAFLIDFFKKNVREFADLVLVRGKWTTATMANQFSDVYYSILSIADQINEFDDLLSEDKELGMKFKTLILRADRDKEARRIIRSVLKDTNNKAMEMLTICSQHLVSFGRSLKNLLNDHEKQHPEMLINWKELDRFTEIPIKDSGVKIYKMIYKFITLMQFYLEKKS